jgi:GrpB-like predicted nucleotidyltransferase (UPF0157 family)
VLVDLIDVRAQVGDDLGRQRRREQLPGRRGKSHPDRRADVGPEQDESGLKIFLGKVRPFTSPRRGRRQGLIIAPGAGTLEGRPHEATGDGESTVGAPSWSGHDAHTGRMGDWLGDSALGLPTGRSRLAPSDPGWPGAFRRLAVELRAATLGDLAVAVEHVGSTAVPGLAATPILDVVVGLAPGTDPDRVITALAPLGAQFRGDTGGEGGLLLVIEDQPARRVAHLHLVGHGDLQWRRYLALRDRLRADPTARTAYAQLKGRVAVRFSGDRRAYTAAKAAFIGHLLSEDGRTATPTQPTSERRGRR